MKYVILSLVTTVALSACVTAKEVCMADGRLSYNIDCSDPGLSWGKCYQKAGDVCGSEGYDILLRSGDQGSTMSARELSTYAGTV